MTVTDFVAEVIFQQHGILLSAAAIERCWPRDEQGRKLPATAGEIYARFLAERRGGRPGGSKRVSL